MEKQSVGFVQRRFIYLLTMAYAIATFASGILVPIYAFFVQKIGGGILETSQAIAVYSLVYGILTILIHKTKISHTYRIPFLWVGWLIWLFSITIYFMISSLLVLYISQMLNALGDAIYEPIFDEEFSKQIIADPSRGWAFFNGTISIFSSIASLIGGLIASYFGFDILLYCVMGLGTLSFFLIVYYTWVLKKKESLL